MRTEELLQLVASQPEVQETRRVKAWGSRLQALVKSGELQMLDKILQHPDRTSELRTFRYAHLVGPPKTESEIQSWQTRFPRHPLPGDLVELLQHADGVHFWADLDHQRSYFDIAPIEEWHDANGASGPILFDEPVGAL